MNLSHSELAKALGVSRQYAGKLIQRGMLTTSVKAAREWQAAHCPHAGNRSGNRRQLEGATRQATSGATKGGNKRGNQTLNSQLQVPLVGAEGETLEESIERLRQIEKSLGIARGTRWSFSSCNTITFPTCPMRPDKQKGFSNEPSTPDAVERQAFMNYPCVDQYAQFN